MYRIALALLVLAIPAVAMAQAPAAKKSDQPAKQPTAKERDLSAIAFAVSSVRSGAWSDPKTWRPARVPGKDDRVRVSRGTRVVYDAQSKDVIRLLQVVGTLTFARDRDTELNVAVLKVQNHDGCSEHGFACDFEAVNDKGEP